MEDLSALSAPDLPDRLKSLGFEGDDARDAQDVVRTVLAHPRLRDAVAQAAGALRGRLGAFLDGEPAVRDPFVGLPRDAAGGLPAGLPAGALPLVALLATSDDVAAWHAARGIAPQDSGATLGDLGRQATLHRRATGTFGLGTYYDLLPHWQGSLHELGRLQLELVRVRLGGRRGAGLPEHLRRQTWLVTVRIPAVGPLRSRAVSDSLERARGFFDAHFPGTEPRFARCTSWLLDPYLGEVLPPESHVVRFQRRFTPFGESSVADEDAVYFTFGHRGLHRLEDLPRETTLQRAVVDRITSGGHWHLVQGWAELP